MGGTMVGRVFAKRRVEHVTSGTEACGTDSSRTRKYGEIKQSEYSARHLMLNQGLEWSFSRYP